MIVITAPERIKRTPNGNTHMMRYLFAGSTYKAYGRNAEDCIQNAYAQYDKLKAEQDRRIANSVAQQAWLREHDSD